MGFVDLFFVALVPVLKTLIITAVGVFLALERVNLLGSTARHHLNNLVFYIFTPALVASSLAETVTSSNIVSLWFMPVNILLTFIIGSALGWILVKITAIPVDLHGLVISCCAAGNLGNLLLIIIPAVCEEKNSPFGDSITCSTNGKAYASLSMAVPLHNCLIKRHFLDNHHSIFLFLAINCKYYHISKINIPKEHLAT